MKQFLNLFRYEMRMLFLSPTTYIAAVIFLSLMGFIYLFIIEGYNNSPQENPSLTEFFRSFWIPVFFIVPLLTMKSIAEEKRLGTLETLFTTSATPIAIVLSKFLSAYVFYIFLWIITLSYPLIVKHSNPSTAHSLTNSASLIGGLLFIATSGILFVSIGIFTSSLTRSQLVAGTLSFSLLFLIIAGGRVLIETSFLQNDWINTTNFSLEYFQTFQQLDNFSRGIIDTRPFFFYIGNSFLVLGLTSIILKAKT